MNKSNSFETEIRFIYALIKLFKIFSEIIREGIKKSHGPTFPLGSFIWACASFVLCYPHGLFNGLNTAALGWELCWGLLFICGLSAVWFCLGFSPWRMKKSLQKSLSGLGFQDSLGEVPKVVSFKDLEGSRRKLLIKSSCIGIDRFKSKQSDIEAAFNATVESIKTAKTPRFVEILLSLRPLPKKVAFAEVIEQANKELSFTVGLSHAGPIIVDLKTLPHLLIAGTTGGGKSVFFKQVLLSLLKNTPHLQLYLIDLKKGVEMRPFGALGNITVAKTEQEAVDLLAKLKDEMDSRFAFLEKNKAKEIIPHKHGKDRIVVGVDEASIIYTRLRSQSEKKRLVEKARELTDELAKLSRAAGMHLILATQKVTRETIDTKVQENIGGRMCFKMNTLQGSMTVLANKRAHSLPDIKGRGIWAQGTDFFEVQAPFLSEGELEAELKGLKTDCFGPMLTTNSLSTIQTDDKDSVKGDM